LSPYDPSKIDPVPLTEYGGWQSGGAPVTLDVHAFNYNGGHTVGFAADAGGAFHPLWVGSSTGSPQLFTSSITATGDVQRNGDKALADFSDVSTKVRVLLLNRFYHRKSGLAEADVVIENASRDTIRTPLKARVLELGSDLGYARVSNADAGGDGEGAVWDLTTNVNGGVLLPGQQTTAKRIQFAVRDLPQVLRPLPDRLNAGLAAFRLKILSPAAGHP